VRILFLFGSRNHLHKDTRRLNRQIKKMHALHKKMELKGCTNDSELREKEAALEEIRREILALENEREKLWSATVSHYQPDQEEP